MGVDALHGLAAVNGLAAVTELSDLGGKEAVTGMAALSVTAVGAGAGGEGYWQVDMGNRRVRTLEWGGVRVSVT